ncbi:meprin A subunit beta-like isoform X1 [Acanthopagrus latus]|uniref:meprin A subunit beta-like isoform X1 n=1 Tax=Acanthopagrus latus TaxID=8177 RepID=UPI00187BD83C|nr:meprin A subunit beta-like isoform X1 [Acanthopagrus latus]
MQTVRLPQDYSLGHATRMRGLIFIVVNLAVSSAFTINPDELEIGEIGGEKNITDINNESSLPDDILEPPNLQRSAIIDEDRLWTSPVPYVLDNDLEMNAKGVILKAMEQFRLKSCIDFKPKDSEDYYISVQKLGGCFSYIGKQLPNGQTLSIGRFCDEISTVEHEILHALGFFHEQSRYDRDDFVTILFKNIKEGFENNFRLVDKSRSTTNGVPYDYWSVMHYNQYAFNNGSEKTIITKDPSFQDVIGQRLEMSPSDVLELNRLYKCKSTIAFKMYCGFSNGTMCHMSNCSQSGSSWEMVTRADGGPSSDHTSLPSGNSTPQGPNTSSFMHASTASGTEGDSAWLETQRMSSNRECQIQCLQFYYYHSGNELDVLNIWLREFQDEWDSQGSLRLVGQITGPQTSHWQLHHVSLNATKHFQVEFEARKGAGSSSGGFSIDDINLSEVECPHVTMQFDDFEKLLNTSKYGTTILSPRQYSTGGYAYRVGIKLSKTFVGIFVQLLSGKNDKQLQWPCPQRQVTFQMLDQTPNIQQHMSKQRSITTDLSTISNGAFRWGNPRDVGTPFVDENNETIFAGPASGRNFFTDLEEMRSRQFIKGGSVVFAFSFHDLTPLLKGSVLPCPKVGPVEIRHPQRDLNKAPCSTRIGPTSGPSPPTTASTTTEGDDSIFGFSPGLLASPVLTFLLALMLMTA